MDKLLICNNAGNCDNDRCTHRLPHSYIKGESHPTCTDNNVYCYPKDKSVNCVELLHISRVD